MNHEKTIESLRETLTQRTVPSAVALNPRHRSQLNHTNRSNPRMVARTTAPAIDRISAAKQREQLQKSSRNPTCKNAKATIMEQAEVFMHNEHSEPYSTLLTNLEAFLGASTPGRLILHSTENTKIGATKLLIRTLAATSMLSARTMHSTPWVKEPIPAFLSARSAIIERVHDRDTFIELIQSHERLLLRLENSKNRIIQTHGTLDEQWPIQNEATCLLALWNLHVKNLQNSMIYTKYSAPAALTFMFYEMLVQYGSSNAVARTQTQNKRALIRKLDKLNPLKTITTMIPNLRGLKTSQEINIDT